MKLHPMKAVTVITEAHARGPLLRLLRDIGAHGYTLTHVEGEGAGGERLADLPESANIKVKVLLPPDGAERLMERVVNEFFPRFSTIAYETDVRVLRPEKF